MLGFCGGVVRRDDFEPLGGQVIRQAVAGRPFTGARSRSAVLDARTCQDTGWLPPATHMPSFADPDLAWYVAGVAAAMDDRQRRTGEHPASGHCGPSVPSARPGRFVRTTAAARAAGWSVSRIAARARLAFPATALS